MKKHYDFSTGRYFTPAELEENRKAIEAMTGKKLPRRPGPKIQSTAVAKAKAKPAG